ncbi:MAG: histidine kinase [Ignavibacteriaceae bacterium]|jgi:signal transduction histidine kinase
MDTKDLIFNLNNPILFSLLTILALLGVIYIFYVYIIVPLNRIHNIEKGNLELKNAKLMALFAELDPDPIFRFNTEGKFILANKAVKELLGKETIEGEPIYNFFPPLKDYNLDDVISKGQAAQFSVTIEDNYYDVIVKGVPEMQFGQIYCNNITRRKLVEDELTQYQASLREFSNRIQKLQEEEKQKLSRELHDSFGQKLTSIKLNLELLKSSKTDMKRKDEIVNDISSLLENAMLEVREISYRLKPRILEDFGLVPSLKALCNEISGKSGINGIFQAHKFDQRLNPELETGLYRITQEALNNMVKHSKAKEFSVQLVRHPDVLMLMIEDDGVGFDPQKIKSDPAKKNHLGLVNMSERVLSFNGKFLLDSHLGGGTEIIVEIPMET